MIYPGLCKDRTGINGARYRVKVMTCANNKSICFYLLSGKVYVDFVVAVVLSFTQ